VVCDNRGCRRPRREWAGGTVVTHGGRPHLAPAGRGPRPPPPGAPGGGAGGESEDIRWRLNGDLSVREVSFITVGIRSEECVVSKEVYENPKKKK